MSTWLMVLGVAQAEGSKAERYTFLEKMLSPNGPLMNDPELWPISIHRKWAEEILNQTELEILDNISEGLSRTVQKERTEKLQRDYLKEIQQASREGIPILSDEALRVLMQTAPWRDNLVLQGLFWPTEKFLREHRVFDTPNERRWRESPGFQLQRELARIEISRIFAKSAAKREQQPQQQELIRQQQNEIADELRLLWWQQERQALADEQRRILDAMDRQQVKGSLDELNRQVKEYDERTQRLWQSPMQPSSGVVIGPGGRLTPVIPAQPGTSIYPTVPGEAFWSDPVASFTGSVALGESVSGIDPIEAHENRDRLTPLSYSRD